MTSVFGADRLSLYACIKRNQKSKNLYLLTFYGMALTPLSNATKRQNLFSSRTVLLVNMYSINVHRNSVV